MNRFVAIAAVLALSAGSAFAAPNCKTGIPCGNSCISKDKVCHKGTTTASSAAPVKAPAPAAAATPAAKPAAAATPAATTKSTKAKCKNASGKYAKCGTPGAVPA